MRKYRHRKDSCARWPHALWLAVMLLVVACGGAGGKAGNARDTVDTSWPVWDIGTASETSGDAEARADGRTEAMPTPDVASPEGDGQTTQDVPADLLRDAAAVGEDTPGADTPEQKQDLASGPADTDEDTAYVPDCQALCANRKCGKTGPGGVCDCDALKGGCNDNDPCTADVCNAAGACGNYPGNDGAVCNDKKDCTRDDRCSGGACVGTAYSCNGHGTCTGTACTCEPTFSGSFCEKCADGFVAWPSCVSQTLVWYDQATNKMWQITPPAAAMAYATAINYCIDLTLAGFTDWHLASVNELRSIIRGCPATMTGGDCLITDMCLDWVKCYTAVCNGCVATKGPDAGCYWVKEMEGPCAIYWSSMPIENMTGNPDYGVNFSIAQVYGYHFWDAFAVRCVRNVQ